MMTPLLLLVLPLAVDIEVRVPEGTLHGFPIVRDETGRSIGVGDMKQWIERGRLHVQLEIDLADGRHIEEKTVLAARGRLEQLTWSIEERRGKAVLRKFSLDLASGRATTSKVREDGGTDSADVRLDGTRGAFCGIGISYAVKNQMVRLDAGEAVTLSVVAFTPKPRVAKVTVSHIGTGQLAVGGRKISAGQYLVHPEVPAIAKLFEKVPDATLWFAPSPPGLLRADIQLLEPSDPTVRIETIGAP